MIVASGPILQLDGVRKSFGGVPAVAGASFAVRRGSLTALIGPNGAGKTTVFDLITGFVSLDAGSIRFEGHPIEGRATHRIARLGLVRTFQLTRVFAAMTVRDNMLLAGARQPGESLPRLLASPRSGRMREAELQVRAKNLLDRFSLAEKAEDYAGTLSGGQRKLLEFARALMTDPRLMLLDEPMAGVNKALGRQLLDHVEELRRSQDLTFLFVEHDMNVVMSRADHVIVMAEGAVIAEGPPGLVRREQRVVDAYLGAARAHS